MSETTTLRPTRMHGDALWYFINFMFFVLWSSSPGRFWPVGAAVFAISTEAMFYRGYLAARWFWLAIIFLITLMVPAVWVLMTFVTTYKWLVGILFVVPFIFLARAIIRWIGSQALAPANNIATDHEATK